MPKKQSLFRKICCCLCCDSQDDNDEQSNEKNQNQQQVNTNQSQVEKFNQEHKQGQININLTNLIDDLQINKQLGKAAAIELKNVKRNFKLTQDQIISIEERQTQSDYEKYKYNCPICLVYYNKILKMKCCKNYVCFECEYDIYQQMVNKKIEPKCWWCKSDDCEIVDVNDGEEIKNYSDVVEHIEGEQKKQLDIIQSIIKESKILRYSNFKKAQGDYYSNHNNNQNQLYYNLPPIHNNQQYDNQSQSSNWNKLYQDGLNYMNRFGFNFDNQQSHRNHHNNSYQNNNNNNNIYNNNQIIEIKNNNNNNVYQQSQNNNQDQIENKQIVIPSLYSNMQPQLQQQIQMQQQDNFTLEQQYKRINSYLQPQGYFFNNNRNNSNSNNNFNIVNNNNNNYNNNQSDNNKINSNNVNINHNKIVQDNINENNNLKQNSNQNKQIEIIKQIFNRKSSDMDMDMDEQNQKIQMIQLKKEIDPYSNGPNKKLQNNPFKLQNKQLSQNNIDINE